MPSKTTIAIGAITAILITALIKNIDSALMITGVTAIAGLGGYALGKAKK